MAGKVHPAFTEARFKAYLIEAVEAPVAFAFALDKQGEDHVLLFNKKIVGKPLLKLVRREKKHVEKGTWGQAHLEGKTLMLDCERRLDGIVKAGKLWVKQNRHPKIKKIRVLLEGEELEADENVAETADGKDTQDQASRLRNALVSVLKAARDRGVSGDKLEAVALKAKAAIEAGDTKQAKKIVLAIQSSGRAPLSHGDLGKLWAAAKKKAISDIAAVKRCAELEFPKLKPDIKRLDGILALFDQRLESSLAQADVSPDAMKRSALQAQARKVAREYSDIVSKNQLISHLESNPYLKVDLQKTLGQPLREIQKCLS